MKDKGDEDEVIWSSQLGTGKGFLYFIQADGGNDIGTRDTPNRTTLPNAPFSRIRYKFICANPASIKPDNSCKCKRVVDLEWEYASNYHWSVNDGWYIWGSSNSIYLEDWAIAALSAPSGDEILEQSMASKRGACDSDPVSSTFTQLSTVAQQVSTAINSPTISNVITGAGGVLDFFGTVTTLASCNQTIDSTAVLLSGNREDIELGTLKY